MKNTKTSSPALSVERSEAERSEDERGATAGGQGVADRPNPEVVASAKRRSFTAEYKLRILAEADAAASQPGASFALNRQQLLDFGFRAVVSTEIADIFAKEEI